MFHRHVPAAGLPANAADAPADHHVSAYRVAPAFFEVFGLVISLDGGFDDVDESFVALASASFSSATSCLNAAISADCFATSF